MSFTFLFYQHITFRESCYKCHFANTIRPSDITIADFWGWEKTDSSFNADDKGCSLVLLNTDKGRRLFEAVRGDMNVIPANLHDCLQPNMKNASPKHSHREQFEKDYRKYGFKYIYYRYGNVGIIYRLRQIKAWTRKIIGRR